MVTIRKSNGSVKDGVRPREKHAGEDVFNTGESRRESSWNSVYLK